MLLEFEKPIVELEEKLSGMKELAKDSDASVAEAILTLEKKDQEVEKGNFSKSNQVATCRTFPPSTTTLYARLHLWHDQ